MVTSPRKLVVLVAVLGWAPIAAAQDYGGMSPGGHEAPAGSHQALFNYYTAGHQVPLAPEIMPRDPHGPARMQMPTPVRGHDFHGVSDVALNTRPDAKTVGIRLDTTYNLIRDTSFHAYSSEHQSVSGGGVTILPWQTPCYVVGLRGIVGATENLSMTQDVVHFSLDLYTGWRYKTTYFKVGPLWDHQESFGKVGVAFAALTDFPWIGTWTTNTAFSFGYGGDIVGLPRGPALLGRRVENADFDMQIRVGRFFTENVEMGATGNYYTFENTSEEWGAGAYMNLHFGRARVGLDLTGGDEGLRGFVTLAWSWGAPPCEHPRDCRVRNVDAVEWVTRAVDRDVSVRLRDSFTGILPPGAPIP